MAITISTSKHSQLAAQTKQHRSADTCAHSFRGRGGWTVSPQEDGNCQDILQQGVNITNKTWESAAGVGSCDGPPPPWPSLAHPSPDVPSRQLPFLGWIKNKMPQNSPMAKPPNLQHELNSISRHLCSQFMGKRYGRWGVGKAASPYLLHHLGGDDDLSLQTLDAEGLQQPGGGGGDGLWWTCTQAWPWGAGWMTRVNTVSERLW